MPDTTHMYGGLRAAPTWVAHRHEKNANRREISRRNAIVLDNISVMRRLLLLSLVFVSCAANQASPVTNRGYLASLQVVQPNLDHAPMPELEVNARASDYLALGLSNFNANKRIEAIRAFSHALSTG